MYQPGLSVDRGAHTCTAVHCMQTARRSEPPRRADGLCPGSAKSVFTWREKKFATFVTTISSAPTRAARDMVAEWAPGKLVWLYGFGGVKVGTRPGWPGIVHDADDAEEKVRRARKAGSVLVLTFGDNAYVWAKPTALGELVGADDALNRASSRVAPAIRAALQHIRQEKGSAGNADDTPEELPSPATSVDGSRRRTPEFTRAPSKPSVDAGDSGGLSAYELQRLENIRANQRALEALGVGDAAKACTPSPRPTDPNMRAAKAAERAARLAAATANRRTSSRIGAVDEEGRAKKRPLRYADEPRTPHAR